MKDSDRWNFVTGPALRTDLPSILRIESETFPDPWTEARFRRSKGDLIVARFPFDCQLGATSVVVGYLVYRSGKTYRIENMAVDSRCRRVGCGTALIDAIKRKTARMARPIEVAIWERNEVGRKFFSSRGFLGVEVLRGWFDSIDDDVGREDAYLMRFEPGRSRFVPRNRLKWGDKPSVADV